MGFPNAFLDELRARLPLSEVVGRRVQLRRAGREFQACCPFHNEKSPSFTVNDKKGFFHCFGCGAHGDAIGFVMQFHNLEFREAVERLAGEAGLDVPRETPQERQREQQRAGLHQVLEMACQFFQAQLAAPGGRAAREYLLNRGLDAAAIAEFRLGYAPADFQALRSHLAKQNVTDQQMVEAGLLKMPEEAGRKPFGFFRDRVIFPVGDRRGRIVGFGARLMGGEGPKYLNSPDTELFHKGQLLYGMARAREAGGDGRPVIVVEGYMDVIALVRAGWPGAVAPLGTALTEQQIEVLWRFMPEGRGEPILCFDGDTAGRRAAQRAVDRIMPLLGPGRTARIAFMPAGEDPDSLIRQKGARAMADVLEAARPLAEVLFEMVAAEHRLDTPESRAAFRAALKERCAVIPDRDVQRAYDDFFYERWRAATRPPRDFGGRGGREGWRPAGPAIQRRRPSSLLPDVQEVLVAAVLARPDLLDHIDETFGLMELPAGPLDALRAEVIEAFRHDSGLDAASLRNHLSQRGFSALAERLLGIAERHAPFVRPGVAIEAARSGWVDVYDHHRQRAQVQAELRAALSRQMRDPESVDDAQIAALRGQLLTADDGDEPPSG
ncbi:MAG TPA: DNA primase [Alphaproteobacteria bacterium]|nr:DNA primase [Alphaproteobacteria bacterium]